MTRSSNDSWDHERECHEIKSNNLVSRIQIAPPSALERNDRRAVRCRSRRERPRKLRLLGNEDHTKTREVSDSQLKLFEPDIESFVSCCIPGVTLVAGNRATDGNNLSSTEQGMLTPYGLSLRRATLFRKRSLPLLSFLSSTALATAEKKRKKEEKELQRVIVEKATVKHEYINGTNLTKGSEQVNAEAKILIGMEHSEVNLECKENDTVGRDTSENNIIGASNIVDENNQQPPGPPMKSTSTITTTVTMEKNSNILMPPLLKTFLIALKQCPD